MSKIPLILDIYHVFGLESGFERQKITKITKITKMAKMSTFWAVGESAKNGIFSRPGSRNEFVSFVGYPL